VADSKYGDLIKQARKPENQIKEVPKDQIKEVNLCVKVPEPLRRHWAVESKRQGVTMTEVIIKAMYDRFGAPPKI